MEDHAAAAYYKDPASHRVQSCGLLLVIDRESYKVSYLPHDHARSQQHAPPILSMLQRVPALSTAPRPGFVRVEVWPHQAYCCSSLSSDVSRRMSRWMLAAAGPTASYWMAKVPLWVEIWRNCCRVSLASRCFCLLLLTISLLPNFSPAAVHQCGIFGLCKSLLCG